MQSALELYMWRVAKLNKLNQIKSRRREGGRGHIPCNVLRKWFEALRQMCREQEMKSRIIGNVDTINQTINTEILRDPSNPNPIKLPTRFRKIPAMLPPQTHHPPSCAPPTPFSGSVIVLV